MPIGTCDPATRGDEFNTMELAGGVNGSVVVTVRFGWDGVSIKATGCDGPVKDIRTRNTGATTHWALLPAKKNGSPWVEIPPGTDVTISSPGQLTNLGLRNYSDVAEVRITDVQPT
jgi:hypothetical protein